MATLTVIEEARAATPRGPSAGGLTRLVGGSPAMERLRARVVRVLPTAVPVLLQGETGTGKELLARAIHGGGPRRHGPFVPVNCGALSAELIDAELFGHERGAFTGAIGRRLGRAAEADGGTLFLDEIGELPPLLQCKLLRLLQEGEVQRVGADRPVVVDVRVVAATNRDLRDLVERGAFRADCYYRLSGVVIEVPPLRDRADDVMELADRIVARTVGDLGRPGLALDEAARRTLAAYPWPGNVRELENVVREVVLYAEGPAIGAADVRLALAARSARTVVALGAAELVECLRRCDGNVTRAARELGVSRPTLYKRLRDRGLECATFRPPSAAVRRRFGAAG
ncbi:MAG: sigma-54-dependent Fis family transcriptional regulator [Deltaproteobacteria bacterium]|nr:sigma-54-dependent Fis family transcriptional regulator [Deltaproteobacteria bacterium]